MVDCHSDLVNSSLRACIGLRDSKMESKLQKRCDVVNRLLLTLPLAVLIAVSSSAQSIEARFTTEKTNYLDGEPVFVALTVSNTGNESIWLDFKSPDLLLCDDFGVEVPGAKPADEPWGCGFSVSCGRGLLRGVLPGKSISLRQLLNQQYRLEPGAYSLRARTNIVVHKQNFDSPQIEEADVSGTLEVKVQPADENQLKSVFRPIVSELADSDSMRRGEAAGAIMALAAPFLEDSLVELAKTNYAFGAIAALRKANTPKTRDALAEIGTTNDDPMLRIQAIRNLGRTGDKTYLPLLLRLMQSGERQIQSPAAEAVGTLGGAAAIPSLSALVSSSDAETRSAAANGLGMTRARQAVPILIAMLVDSDANVRVAAVSGLSFLTHRKVFDGSQWADISTADSANVVHGRWVRWWNAHANTSDIHGMADCRSFQPLE